MRNGADTWPRPIGPQEQRVDYAADDIDRAGMRQWGWELRPSIFMPRWASRITLEITEVRVQRVQEIGDEDAQAEGCAMGYDGPYSFHQGFNFRGGFMALWDSINAKRGFGWDANPWVWAISFKKVGES